MTEQDDRRRDKYRRYNASTKGQARHQRYEEKHPERRGRWSSGMIAKGRGNNYEYASGQES
jgi:hypothetical protein